MEFSHQVTLFPYYMLLSFDRFILCGYVSEGCSDFSVEAHLKVKAEKINANVSLGGQCPDLLPSTVLEGDVVNCKPHE